MASPLLDQILRATRELDLKYQKLSAAHILRQPITFPVAPSHPRFAQLKHYTLTAQKLATKDFSDCTLIFLDHKVSKEAWIKQIIHKDAPVILLKSHEIEWEEIKSLNASLQHITSLKGGKIAAIGGGSLLYAVGYIAEQWQCEATYIPTTVLSMSDSSIGGKVRIHRVHDDIYERHFYRSYYEPDRIILDERFLLSLPEHEISIGIAEIVKHAIYQSPGLLAYLLSPAFDPFNNRDSLLKAIMWTADLKRICLIVDPDEHEDGANAILRAAHTVADQLEVESKLQMRHGKAVWRGMELDCEADPEKAKTFADLAKKLWKK